MKRNEKERIKKKPTLRTVEEEEKSEIPSKHTIEMRRKKKKKRILEATEERKIEIVLLKCSYC